MAQYNPNDYDPTKDGHGFTPPPEGDYDFCVIEATDKVSQAGNEMIGLKLACNVGQDKPLCIFDNLIFIPKAIYRVAQFCQATGLDFSKGELLAQDCLAVAGKAHLRLGQVNDKGKRYVEVGWYIKPEGYTERPASSQKLKPAQQQTATPTNAGPGKRRDEDGPSPLTDADIPAMESDPTGDGIPF
jgi:hypothetical protein